jgi:hypothetical protein
MSPGSWRLVSQPQSVSCGVFIVAVTRLDLAAHILLVAQARAQL